MNSSSITTTTATLEGLPAELLLKIIQVMSFQTATRLARTNKAMYTTLIQEIYKRTQSQGWFPMGCACATGNVGTITRCLEAGAPVDVHIPRDIGSHRWSDESYYLVGGWRPLRESLYRLRVDTVKFLLLNGANPNNTAAEARSTQVTTPPLVYAYRRGRESRRNVVKARAMCVLLLLAGADRRVLDPVKQLEVHIMCCVDRWVPVSWRRYQGVWLFFYLDSVLGQPWSFLFSIISLGDVLANVFCKIPEPGV
ncbi:hypothetical protein SNK03_13565 [Fusarium graminearum]|uniref:Chromosome 1, complete genome n=2 Tax=Gibberella zeae TaxID=5518 RepID=I1RDL1_GIBZE|nr:hypothetical protein FGSG_01718 [Fusarium graminearum PH-1]CAF3603664.1 unnamed protein product [Fusarium graminearum]ESU07065.1 hypothetical protein FGSG_01718 [Fusarium graminearum PH-1]CAG1969326.1 unnamed protein product [Fusarium graminearum]CAG1970670.1 unnamed protein product [Fusarium graminearum]CEF73899.1 unnamed protein product [Fusarium graminearum]|eukprot:XP_011317550.1 hypothetical protein FGSG_01718 [Fusarium graminearum PH-1]